MSWNASQWALYEAPENLDPYEFKILMIVADNVDSHGLGFAWSVKRLAQAARMSERTVQNKLRSLVSKNVLRPGSAGVLAYLPANKRPKVYDVCLPPSRRVKQDEDGWGAGDAPQDVVSENTGETPDDRGAGDAPQQAENVENTSLETSRGAGDAPQADETTTNTDSGVHVGCIWGESGVHLGCTLRAPDSLDSKDSKEPRESTRPRKTKKHHRTDPQPLPAGWTPDHDAQALADGLGLDLAAELAKFRDAAASSGRVSRDWQAAFRLWLRHGSELGIASKPSMPAKPVQHHRHSFGCDHVLALLDRDTPEPDGVACRLAELLNEGKPPEEALRSFGRIPARGVKAALHRLGAVA